MTILITDPQIVDSFEYQTLCVGYSGQNSSMYYKKARKVLWVLPENCTNPFDPNFALGWYSSGHYMF